MPDSTTSGSGFFCAFCREYRNEPKGVNCMKPGQPCKQPVPGPPAPSLPDQSGRVDLLLDGVITVVGLLEGERDDMREQRDRLREALEQAAVDLNGIAADAHEDAREYARTVAAPRIRAALNAASDEEEQNADR